LELGQKFLVKKPTDLCCPRAGLLRLDDGCK
jgi:hypothetical protein